MFMFEQCRSLNWDLDLFYNSPKPELSNCLRYWGFNLIPVAVFSIIFLFDLIVNRSLERKNEIIDYFKQYGIRFLIKFSLIISCIYELVISIRFFIDNGNDELSELKLLSSIAKSNVYLLLLIFDISHHSKNMGPSALHASGIFVDFISKSYLIFEISYLHYTSYSLDELIIIIIQFTCFLFLLISYVFIPNLPYTNEARNNINQNKPIFNSDSINQNIHKQKGFSIKSRSLFSQIAYSFYEPFVIFGYKNKYDLNNILPLEDELTVNSVLNDYEINYKNKYLKNSKYDNFNILHLLSRLYSKFYLFNFTIFTIQIIITQILPQIISKLITFIKKQNDYKWHGLLLTALLLACFIIKYGILAIFNRNMNYMQLKIQILLVNCIYRKSLKRSLLKDSESFDTYNLMTIDVNNISNAIYFAGDLIYFPINTTLSIYFIYQEMGMAFFYSLAIFLIVGPITYFISQKTKRSQQRTMKYKDKRLKVLTDLLNGIKSIKLNYWDSIFKEKIDGIRSDEMSSFKKYQIFYSISQTIFHILPILLSVLTFFFYITIDDRNVLTPENAFTTLNYFNLLKGSFFIIPRFIHLGIMSTISAKRISKFLSSNEKDDYIKSEFNEQNAVEISKNVNFSWQNSNKKSSEFTLKNLNIKIKKGDLVALISNTIGSGRSSFISCLLGEMRLIANEKNDNQIINISNDMKIAYVGNLPWIEKKSIKDNILFGLPYNQAEYNYVLDQCLIREELIKFKNGDNEIMHKDFDLEIKQKVSLARAYYSAANLILLDDFLNVFNDYSAKLIFDKIINPNKNSLFKGKTIIMCLNRLEYLRYFDQILTFNNGEIKSVDKDQYEFVDTNHIDNNNDYIGDMKKNHEAKTDLYKRSISNKLYNYENLDIPIQTDDHDDRNCMNCCNKKLVHDEDQNKIDFGAYKFYIKSWKYYWLIILIISHLLSIVYQIKVGQHLAYWSKNSNNRTGDALKQYNKDGLAQYVLLYFYNNLFYTTAALAAVFGEIGSAIKFHRLLLNKVLSLKLYFFGKVPKGSIISRFSKDIDCIDSALPFFFRASIFIFFQIITVFYVLISTFPFSSIIIAICTIIYFYLFVIFLRTLVAAKRLELYARTALYNQFEELSSGLQTILAYNKTKLFTQILNQKLESDVNCNFMIYISFKWLALRNEIISIVILIGVSLLSILNDNVDPGKAGLVFNFGLTLLEMLTGLIGIAAELHNNMVSVNRIRQYLNLEEEKDESHSIPPENWPNHGKIKFQKYSAGFAECRAPVLENLDFKIKKYSLNSLVGSSSSGKSTLTYALFNCITPITGTILIDGIDIHKISLKSLRQNLSIMLQESSLFTGTIRFNLDPEDKYTDMEIWTILDYVGLKDQILYLQGNLSYELTQGGSNLSLGQRQLLCLARAMLKKSKIMILDLISCQFDLETEIRLRKLFRTVFKDRTIILITKNLDQILETDKILFLNNKKIQIFEKPEDIFNQNNIDENNNNENSIEVLDIVNNNILDIVNNNVE